MDQGALKKMAADVATAYVKDGQIVGLGTGSTVRYVVAKLAERVRKGLRIRGVATSLETALLASEAGIPLLADDAEWMVDLALDGADQVDPRLNLIKGGGGALLKEKIVAAAAARFVVVVDETKRVPVLGGSFPLPVEVVPFGWRTLAKRLERLDCRVSPRMKDGALFVSEAGHYILDLWFPKIDDPARLETELEKTPGVVCTGLFVGRADLAVVATQQGIVTLAHP
ncbi:MAG TPA: ribose-5-phosphate isomerase RpiA [Nitrospirales bacterium]|nr:ribose-5-phosphate isomerase RpiA [Nitrospirales bacterium]